MTAPIAAFVRPIPDVPAPSAHEGATQSNDAGNSGGFRVALESAMKDKSPTASTRRSERPRRESTPSREAAPLRESTPSRESAERSASSSIGEASARADASAADGTGSLGTQEGDTAVAESFAALVGMLAHDVASDRDDARPTRDGGAKGGTTTASGSPQAPNGGAWMRTAVMANAEPTTSASKRAADVDDGVDLSPNLDNAAAAQRFVETTIGDLAVQGAGASLNDVASSAAAVAASAPGVGKATTTVAPPATAPEEPSVVRRSMDAVSPDLRTRLDRVVARMKSEFGYNVEVVETVRSQSRQDQLFAQGRSTPGEVVTWTRNSKHTQGRAVDVVINGSYDNATAYRDLAQVAREEGLRSLWPRDGGHLELPSIPAQTRAAIDPTMSPSVDPGTAKPKQQDAAVMIPKLPTIPSSASEVVLPHAAKAPEVHQSLGTTPEQQDKTAAFQVTPAKQAPTDASARLTKQPFTGAQSEARSEARPTGLAHVAAVAEVARVANVAAVAHVATVASVAQVAQVTQVAQTAALARDAQVTATNRAITEERPLLEGNDGVPTIASSRPGTTNAANNGVVVASTPGASQQHADSNDAQHRGSGSKRERSREGVVASANNNTDGARHLSTRELATNVVKESLATASDSVGSLARSDATERIARVLKMQESAGDRPLSSVLLRLDAPDGSQDRVRIDLRGSTVGASFDVSDARAADNLRVHANELQQALQQQGLEGDSITVRTTQRSTGPVSASASALAAEREAGRIGSTAASDGGGSTAKDSRNQPRADDWRDGASQQRSRQQRRDSKENR